MALAIQPGNMDEIKNKTHEKKHDLLMDGPVN
jgi:hypothetical protein